MARRFFTASIAEQLHHHLLPSQQGVGDMNGLVIHSSPPPWGKSGLQAHSCLDILWQLFGLACGGGEVGMKENDSEDRCTSYT